MNVPGYIFSRTSLLLLDIAVVVSMPIIALTIRLEGDYLAYEMYLTHLLAFIPLTVPIVIGVFYIFGLYRRLWRYATVQDMLAIVGAVTVAACMVTMIGLYTKLIIPRSVYVMSWIFIIAMMISSRLIVKLTAYAQIPNSEQEKLNRFLIVGAGDAGALIAREIKQRNANSLVGFVDDDRVKIGKAILGVPILGDTQEISELVQQKQITEIIIAMPSADGDAIRRISQLCRKSGCRVRILPGIYELIEGEATMTQLRDIDINDLLRRESVHFNPREVGVYITNKTVMVTGAGGSIGSELARQIARLNPAKLYLLGRGENSVYEIHQEIINAHPHLHCTPIIADVSDEQRIRCIFAEYKPQIVFHAAAHKHVPLMEAQPTEAIKVNIFGTKNLAEAANDNNTEIFVMISTDKAVNPTSVMGASKRTAELVVQNANTDSQTKFVVVRFGNVLGSRGSVIPLFRKQIAVGGPITITHPDMVRYFMTIPEAAQLVMQAGMMAKGGEVFLLDMGKPVRILDMAKDLIELHGLVPDKDIKFVFTGLRPGEKLYEELLTAEEGAEKTANKKIFKAKIKNVDADRLNRYLDILKKEEDRCAIIATMMEVLPSYKSNYLRRTAES